MRIIDADKFLMYLIFSKHIDGLTCGEVKEAIEMCKVDILDKIRAEIEQFAKNPNFGDLSIGASCGAMKAIEIINKYIAESEG